MAGQEIHEKIRRRRFWGIFHRTNGWGFYQGIEVFSFQWTGGRRYSPPAVFLGGLKSADLEGGFKMFQTIFSAPEKSEYNI